MFKTYILHYTRLYERKQHIEQELLNQKIDDFELITDFDKEDLTEDIINAFYKNDKQIAAYHAEISTNYINSEYNHEPMKLASISLCCKWIHAIRNFINTDYDYALFLEDDCKFIVNNIDIPSVVENCPKDWNVIFVGGAFSQIAPIKKKMYNYYLSGHPSTNTTSSLILNKESAKLILKDIIPFYLPIDWELNHIFYKNNFNIYHKYPYLATQLSNKVFRSTVE